MPTQTLRSIRSLSIVAILSLLVFAVQMQTAFADVNYYRFTSASGVDCLLNTQNGKLKLSISDLTAEVISSQDFLLQAEYLINGSTIITDSEFLSAGQNGTSTVSSQLTLVTVNTYPLTIEMRFITTVNGAPVYSSITRITCTGDGAGIITFENSDVVTAASNCIANIPAGAVQGRLVETAQAHYAASADAATTFSLPGGTSWWILDTESGFTELLVACRANPVWVDSTLVVVN